MATALVAVVGSLASGAAAVGTAAASVGASLFASAGSISLTTALSAGFSALSALSSLAEADTDESNLLDQAANLQLQADQSDFQARAEEIEGRRQELEKRKELSDAIASNIVAAGASGIGTSGSVASAISGQRLDAKREISITRENAKVNASLRRAESANTRARSIRLKTAASETKVAGGLKAAGKLGSLFAPSAKKPKVTR